VLRLGSTKARGGPLPRNQRDRLDTAVAAMICDAASSPAEAARMQVEVLHGHKSPVTLEQYACGLETAARLLDKIREQSGAGWNVPDFPLPPELVNGLVAVASYADFSSAGKLWIRALRRATYIATGAELAVHADIKAKLAFLEKAYRQPRYALYPDEIPRVGIVLARRGHHSTNGLCLTSGEVPSRPWVELEPKPMRDVIPHVVHVTLDGSTRAVRMAEIAQGPTKNVHRRTPAELLPCGKATACVHAINGGRCCRASCATEWLFAELREAGCSCSSVVAGTPEPETGRLAEDPRSGCRVHGVHGDRGNVRMFGPSLSQDVHTMRFRAAVLAAGIDGIGSAGQLEAKIVFSSIRHGRAAATAAAAASLSSASTRRWMIHKSSRSLAT